MYPRVPGLLTYKKDSYSFDRGTMNWKIRWHFHLLWFLCITICHFRGKNTLTRENLSLYKLKFSLTLLVFTQQSGYFTLFRGYWAVPRCSDTNYYSFGAPRSNYNNYYSFGAPRSYYNNYYSFGAPRSYYNNYNSFGAPRSYYNNYYSFGALRSY